MTFNHKRADFLASKSWIFFFTFQPSLVPVVNILKKKLESPKNLGEREGQTFK